MLNIYILQLDYNINAICKLKIKQAIFLFYMDYNII